MKIRLLYLIFGTALLAVIFWSNSSGAGVVQGIDRTGSPVGSGSCETCHAGGSFSPVITAQLLKDNVPITQYEPGEDYTYRLTINASSGSPAGYGFQTVALRGDNNVNAGTWDSTPSGTRITTLNNRRYFEHSNVLNSNVIEIKWEAPAAGSGPVRFYAAGNAVNGDGTSGGDDPGTLASPLVIAEQSTSSVFATKLLPAEILVYPNPVADQLNLNIQIKESGRYFLSILDLTGKEVQKETIQLINGENIESLNVKNLAAGHYAVRLSDGERVATTKIVKN